jgi:hypothetical protein
MPPDGEWLDSRPDIWTPTWVPPPVLGTPRTERDTYGPAAGIVAREKLKRPFLPWQQYVADVAMEIHPVTGRLVYRTVIVTVPRQSGKTTGLLFTIMVLRCLAWDSRQVCVYTAQDRNGAREKFEEDFVDDILHNSSLVEKKDYIVRRANGSERIKFLRSGSLIKISATESSSGHGRTLDMPGIDEAWEHRTNNVDMGFKVPMVTRPEPQLWILSTAGNEHSAFLRQKRDVGRAAVKNGVTEGVCYFEWAAPPDDRSPDPDDRKLWWFVMPALGHTITEEAIASDRLEMTLPDFLRSYYNLDQDSNAAEGSPIDEDLWASLVAPAGAGFDGEIAFGLDMPGDRSVVWMAAVGHTPDGVMVEMVGSVPARSAVERVRKLVEAHQGVGVGLCPDGPAGALLEELVLAGVPVQKLGPSAQARATGQLLDRVRGGGLVHLGQPELDDASIVGRLRTVGFAKTWDAAIEGSSPIMAATWALGALLGLGEADSASVYDQRGFMSA